MERRDAEAQSLFFLREQSAQRVAFSSVFFAFSLNYSSASLRLCVRFFRKLIFFTIYQISKHRTMKHFNKLFVLAGLASAALYGCTQPGNNTQEKEMDEFISGLMDKMTLREKLGQLNLPAGGDLTTGTVQNSNLAEMIRKQELGGFFNVMSVEKIRELQRIAVEETRLGIPLVVGADVIHGYQTIFPIPLALACSWDTLATERMAQISAKEATANGIAWTFSPMVDICRDARWGRIAEGNGEDPFIGAMMARAYVRGYQGENLHESDSSMMACLKHFALYGASESGRDYNRTDMSRVQMLNEYLPPYQAAVKAGVGTVMTSFNTINGVPATADKWLIDDVLRKQWGFKGMIVTDYNSIAEMEIHGVAPLKEAGIMAMNAGTDMDMVAQSFLNPMEEAVNEGKVSEARIDEACRRVLEMKYKLGLFENPYKYCNVERAQTETYSEANRAEARRIAAETFVLMKNENQLLPLAMKGRIALIDIRIGRRCQQHVWYVESDLRPLPTLLVTRKTSCRH